jgi:hypothetical protein
MNNLTVPKFDAKIDLLNSANSKGANFKVNYDYQFNVTGKVEAKFGIGLPLGIGVGINVPSKSSKCKKRMLTVAKGAKFDGRLALKNVPEIVASAGISASNKQEECNGGVLLKA